MSILFGIGAGALTFLLERKLKTKGVIMTKKLSPEAKAARKAERTARKNAGIPCDMDTVATTPEACQAVTKLAKPAGQSALVVIGNTAIHNVHLISTKLYEIVKFILTLMEPQSGLFGIIYDGDGNPIVDDSSVMAMLYTDTMTVIFNLEHHWSESLKIAMEDETNCLSLRCLLWYNCILSIFHEIHHAKTIMAAENKHAIVWDDAKEVEATKYAIKQVEALAKLLPIEMPTNEEDPFFGGRFAEFRKFLDECDAPWADFQKRLYDSNIPCSDTTATDERIDVYTFKEWLRMACDTPAERDDPAWGNKASMIFTDKAKELGAGPQVNTLAAEPAASQAIIDVAHTDVFDPNDGLIDDGGYDDEMPDWANSESDEGYHATAAAQVEIPPTPQTFVSPRVEAPAWVSPNPLAGREFIATKKRPAFVNPVAAAMVKGDIIPTDGQPAASSGGWRLATAQPCAPLDIPIDEAIAIAKTVYMRLYMHIFSKCGFCSWAEEKSTFKNAGAVYDGVFIGDIPNVNKVFLSMEVTDREGGKAVTEPITTHIRGQVFKNSFIPGYWLNTNGGGMIRKRSIVPQNPNKLKTDGSGNLSPMAIKVRNEPGLAVMWIISEKYVDMPESEMVAKIETLPGAPLTTYTPFPFRK